MDMEKSLTRRQVCRAALVGAPACAVVLSSVGTLLSAGSALAAPAALALVSESDPMAKNLKYVHDASKAKREKRGATEGKDQTCNNCQMYTKQGMLNGKEVGKCLMIASGSVDAKGWCMTWTKKA